MTAIPFLDGRVTLHGGDCLDILKTLPDASIDSVVTDPPYHLTSIVKRFGGTNAAPAKTKQTGAFARSSKGFMGQTWDGGDIAFREELWAEVLRVLKPGGHLAAFSGTRTYHRMAVAIEDAGFEIRDQLAWTYGSGFAKSQVWTPEKAAEGSAESAVMLDAGFAGWGRGGLKPAWEPICLARKPLDGTVAANVLAHGVGALNIAGCRVGDEVREAAFTSLAPCKGNRLGDADTAAARRGTQGDPKTYVGRFPANLIHDGSPEVLAAFPDAPGQQREVNDTFAPKTGTAVYGDYGPRPTVLPRDKGGSAARFFYTAKADADDRIGSKHPTVKPVDLMQWLVRLVTPKGGVVLDLFAGTGTTGEAAWREGCQAVLIEREPVYRGDIARRMALAAAGPQTRRAAIAAVKAAEDHGPLFTLPEAAE